MFGEIDRIVCLGKAKLSRRAGLRPVSAAIAVMVALCGFAEPAAAWEDCLKFEYADSAAPGRSHIGTNFLLALREAGICAKLYTLPAKRGLAEVRAGRLDGSVLRVPAAKAFFGDQAMMIGEQLAAASGLLVSKDPALTSLDALKGRTVGIRLGIKWQLDLIPADVKVASVPEYRNQILMLRKGHIDAILLDSVVAAAYAADLKDFTMTKLVDLSAYPWIRSEFSHRAGEIAAAIRTFRASGRSFTDPPPLIN